MEKDKQFAKSIIEEGILDIKSTDGPQSVINKIIKTKKYNQFSPRLVSKYNNLRRNGQSTIIGDCKACGHKNVVVKDHIDNCPAIFSLAESKKFVKEIISEIKNKASQVIK